MKAKSLPTLCFVLLAAIAAPSCKKNEDKDKTVEPPKPAKSKWVIPSPDAPAPPPTTEFKKEPESPNKEVLSALVALRARLGMPNYPPLLENTAKIMLEISPKLVLAESAESPAGASLKSFRTLIELQADRFQKRSKGPTDFAAGEWKTYADEVAKLNERAGELMTILK